MFPLFRKNLLSPPSCCSSSSSQVRSFLIRLPFIDVLSSSPSPPSPPTPEPPMVWVWWDVDNCDVPPGVSYWNVAPSITAAVRANGIKGGIQIHAYSSNLSELDKRALYATGISLSPGGFLLRDLRASVSRPPPLHHFVIFDDKHERDFSSILHRFRMNNYNILLACRGRGSDILRSATTIMWQWSSMLKREDLVGKHFNYPPDGPFDSCYEDSKAPLENPFSYAEEPTSSQNVNNVDDNSKSFQSIPSQGEYVDGESTFPYFRESNVHQIPNELQKTSLGSKKVVDVACTLLPAGSTSSKCR